MTMKLARLLRDPPAVDPAAAKLYGAFARALETDWTTLARPSQLPPQGDWRIWLLLAGRGFGKTRSGAEFVRAEVEAGRAKRIALVAPTAADCRDVLIEGESGLLAISPEHFRPTYEPSKRRLTWPNGAMALAFSADEPERLRGPQHDLAWCDEVAAWRYPSAWDNLMLGLRIGTARAVVTTTPKPTRLVRDLLKREGKDVVVSRGRTEENRANLAPAFFDTIMAQYAGTRLGRQELDAEILEDTPGALWTRDMIERARMSEAPQLARVVVAIDPAGGSAGTNDECGIVVCGTDGHGHGFVLDDLSGRYQPDAWARRAVQAYYRHKADRIVAEENFGGAMVQATIRAVDSSVPYKKVIASRGKVLRAEPISAFYEQNRVHHVGCFPALEDQMAGFSSDFNRATTGYSPDRIDALVFALSELLVGESCEGWLGYYQHLAERAHASPKPAVQTVQANALDMTEAVTMKAPAPWINFYVSAPDGRSRQYNADGAGLIHQVARVHVEGLQRSGCVLIGTEHSAP